jgi:hypothetical protein
VRDDVFVILLCLLDFAGFLFEFLIRYALARLLGAIVQQEVKEAAIEGHPHTCPMSRVIREDIVFLFIIQFLTVSADIFRR